MCPQPYTLHSMDQLLTDTQLTWHMSAVACADEWLVCGDVDEGVSRQGYSTGVSRCLPVLALGAVLAAVLGVQIEASLAVLACAADAQNAVSITSVGCCVCACGSIGAVLGQASCGVDFCNNCSNTCTDLGINLSKHCCRQQQQA